MQDIVDSSAFRRLLHSLENSDVRIRLRCSGEPWTGFSKLLLLSESAMILQSGEGRRVIITLKDVVQLQLEKSFLGLASETVYTLTY